MPFGLDMKTAIVTVIFVYFVLPYLLGAVGRLRGNDA